MEELQQPLLPGDDCYLPRLLPNRDPGWIPLPDLPRVTASLLEGGAEPEKAVTGVPSWTGRKN